MDTKAVVCAGHPADREQFQDRGKTSDSSICKKTSGSFSINYHDISASSVTIPAPPSADTPDHTPPAPAPVLPRLPHRLPIYLNSPPTSARTASAAAAISPYPVQPLPGDHSRVALEVRSWQPRRRLPPLQPLSGIRSRAVPGAADSEHGRELPPFQLPHRNASRVVPTTAILGHGRRLPPLQPLTHNAARRAATEFRPFSSNSSPPPPFSPTASYFSQHHLLRPPPQPLHLHPHQHQYFPPQPSSPSARTPIQIIARRNDYARPSVLVQWLEPGVPESWQSEPWMREHGWGWMLDDYIRTGGQG